MLRTLPHYLDLHKFGYKQYNISIYIEFILLLQSMLKVSATQ